MKKIMMLCVCCYISCLANAQKLRAVYEYIPSGMATFKEHVYFENGVKTAVLDSIWTSTDLEKEVENEEEEIPNSSSFQLNTGTKYRQIVIQKENDNLIKETRSIKGKNYLVEDQFPELVWNTDYPDVDTLARHVCHKATAKYRGTTLVAYYTEEIPVPVGPSKFGGLPGLIVMLYNESANPNYWYLKEVVFPYQGTVPVNENYIFKLPKLSLQEFVEKEDKMIDEQMRIIASKIPVIEGMTSESKKVRGGVEQVYEWEK
ncbi:MAG: GLPGLI family protein [Sphingobacterium sp.]|nr:GLPGLI family protein [Sphingobacterium sp.]